MPIIDQIACVSHEFVRAEAIVRRSVHCGTFRLSMKVVDDNGIVQGI